MSFYQDDFYEDLHGRTVYPAETILDIVFETIPAVNSVVDVGCAVGSWLSVCKRKGVNEIQGIDGDWVNEDFLEIPRECFQSFDLSKPFGLDRTYDLAMSLEVAEHLPESSARGFIESLSGLSDFVLFSAAIPFQGGTNHVNEQWLEYWVDLYSDAGYRGLDIIRRKIWFDEKIPFWYKQNMILFVRENRLNDVKNVSDLNNVQPISLVHPEQYSSAKVARRIVVNEMKKKIRSLL